MDNAMRELLEEYRKYPEQVKYTVIIPMAVATLAFVGGILIGAIFS